MAASRPSPRTLALYLVARGWRVGVYCQDEVDRSAQRSRRDDLARHRADHRRGRLATARRRRSPSTGICVHDARGAAASASCSATTGRCSCLICALRGGRILTNMDGIEWRRPKWSAAGAGLVLGQRVDRGLVVATGSSPTIRPSPTISRPAARARRSPRSPTAATRSAPAPTAPLAARARTGPLSRLDRPDRARQQHPDDGRGVLAQAARHASWWCSARSTTSNAYHRARAGRGGAGGAVPGRDLRGRASCRRCASTPAPTSTATRSAAPTRRWSRRSGPATR